MPTEYFERRERALLGDRFDALYAAPQDTAARGVTVSALRAAPEQFAAQADFPVEPSPFCKAGFVVQDPAFKPGRHPYHHAGVFYSQEPSASSAAPLLGVRPGMRVLDTCAAPGGKSSQLAAALQGQGLLLANEFVAARAEILRQNLERMGVTNAVITNEDTARLAAAMPGQFDRVLVDAPCSGEGMFRKEAVAAAQHNNALVAHCAELGAEILENAAALLAPGGVLVYSTCTFAPAENEGSISRFLERHPEFELLPAEKKDGMMPGVPAWTDHPAEGLEHTIRLWPHKLKGEGHYLAVLQKAGVLSRTYQGYCRNGVEKGINEKECREFFAFAEENLVKNITGSFLKFGDQLYRMPEGMPSIRNLKVLRPGLHLGTLKKNRFEPSHALALALRPDQVKHVCNLESDDPQVKAYLNGQTLNMDGEKGWYLVAVDGYSIGWGKLAGGILKNHYPKGLRKNG